MLNIDEIISSATYEISDSFGEHNLGTVSSEVAEETFRNHDDVIDNIIKSDRELRWITCLKFFAGHCIIGMGLVIDNKLSIAGAYKIPEKFIDTLPSKDFVTILLSFLSQVSEYDIPIEEIEKIKHLRKEVQSMANLATIFTDQYADFLKRFS